MLDVGEKISVLYPPISSKYCFITCRLPIVTSETVLDVNVRTKDGDVRLIDGLIANMLELNYHDFERSFGVAIVKRLNDLACYNTTTIEMLGKYIRG